MPKVSEITDQNYVDLAVMIGANIRSLPPEAVAHYLSCNNRGQIPLALRRGFVTHNQCGRDDVANLPPIPKIIIPSLSSTGPTFGEWLKAREDLHKFLMGETVVLRDLFEIGEETLARTDIMPFFRPTKATNRMAMGWKVKLGMPKPYEEADVMRYKISEGPSIPVLGFINRSITPDANTLGKDAKSPIDLRKVRMEKLQAWLNLFGWSDADNLHFLITGKHLDPNTLSWFPNDMLTYGRVAYGDSRGGQAGFRWLDSGRCDPCIGARLVHFFELRIS